MWASWLLGDVVHARVHAQEAAPSLAAADALFDQLFQLHQRGDGRAAVAEGSRQVGVGVGIHRHYAVAKVAPAAGQGCRHGGFAHSSLAGDGDFHGWTPGGADDRVSSSAKLRSLARVDRPQKAMVCPTSQLASAATAGEVALNFSSEPPVESSSATSGSCGTMKTCRNLAPATPAWSASHWLSTRSALGGGPP